MKKTLATILMVLAATSAQAEKITVTDKIKLSSAKELLQSGNNAAKVKDWTSACMYYGAATQTFLELSHKDKRIEEYYHTFKKSEKSFCKAAGLS